MGELVLDTVVLRTLAFARSNGIAVLLESLDSEVARFPAEVYNRDENHLPLEDTDEALSEFARGLRHARRGARRAPAADAARYQAWLDNATQLDMLFDGGRLVVDPLTVEELPRREDLQDGFGIGRGEAACIVLAERYRASVLFLSSNTKACRTAGELEISFATIEDVLQAFVDQVRPDRDEFEAFVEGLRAAKYTVRPEVLTVLRNRF